MKNIFKIKTTNKIMKRITLTATIDMVFIMLLTGLAMFLMSMQASAQNVGINNTTPHTKSLLDLTSSDKGLLTPRMTEAQRTGMFPAPDATAKGMLVYQTDNVQGFYVYNGATWQMVTTGNSGWGLTGNTGTNPTTNFIGTSDNKDAVFKANNNEAFRITPNNKINISNNNATPSYAYARMSIADENGNNSDVNVRVAGGSYSQLIFDQSGGTLATPAASANGHWSGVVVGRSHDGTTFTNTSAMILGVDSAVTPGAMRGNIQFQTAGGTQIEKMRINRNGDVSIGNISPKQRLDVTGNINMSNDTNNIRINNIRVLSTAGTSNTFVGRYSGISNTGTFNTFIGDSAGMSNTSGGSNVGVGSNVLKSNTTGNWNTAVGSRVLLSNTTGFSNTGVGIGTLIKNTSGYRNTAIGGGGMQELITGFENTSVGYYALLANKTGHSNVAVGVYALNADTSGHSNTAVGKGAGLYNNGGIKNVFTGTWAGAYNTTGSFNVFSGFDAGGHNITGERNTCIGFSSAFTNTAGADNTFLGNNTGYLATGGMNTFIGSSSGSATTTGINNVFMGYNSGNLNTTGSRNIAIGNNAQVGTTFSNAIAIGNNAVAGASNTMILGGTGADGVNVGIGTTTPSAKLHVTSDGATGSQNIKMTETGTDYSRLGFYNGGTTKFWETAAYSDPVDSLSRFHIFNSSTINLLTVAGNGRIGISNSNPTVPLSFNGNLGDKISLFPWGGGHYGFGVVAATLQMYSATVNDDIAFGYGSSSNFTERMRIKGNGDVGIGTNAPTATLEVNGFTKLGSNAPAVKMIKFTGTTHNLQGNTASITHGLNIAKILSVSVLVEKSSTSLIPPNQNSTGDEYIFQVTGTQVLVSTIFGNSANILSKPFRVLITYEE